MTKARSPRRRERPVAAGDRSRYLGDGDLDGRDSLESREAILPRSLPREGLRPRGRPRLSRLSSDGERDPLRDQRVPPGLRDPWRCGLRGEDLRDQRVPPGLLEP